MLIPLSIAQLEAITSGQAVGKTKDLQIAQISIDSRQI
jgi:hypothetical protein